MTHTDKHNTLHYMCDYLQPYVGVSSFFHTHTLAHSISTPNLESFPPSFNKLCSMTHSQNPTGNFVWHLLIAVRLILFVCLFSSCLDSLSNFLVFHQQLKQQQKIVNLQPLQKLKGDSIGIWILKQEVRITGELCHVSAVTLQSRQRFIPKYRLKS